MALTVYQVVKKAQPAVFGPGVDHTSTSVAWTTPTAGHTLTLAFSCCRPVTPATVNTPSGWSRRADLLTSDNIRQLVVFTKVSDGTEGTVTVTHSGGHRTLMHMMEHDGGFGAIVTDTDGLVSTHAIPSLTPTASVEALLIGFILEGNLMGITTGPTGYTYQGFISADTGASEGLVGWTRYVASTTGSYTGSVVYTGNCYSDQVQLVFYNVDPPVAEFTSTDTDIFEGETVDFIDLSTNVPTSWLWDFGDGGTSTSQNPSHVYTAAGSYTVSLTATNANGSDTETKTTYINVAFLVGFEEPPPAGVLLEIYAAAPGSARWDQANWDEAEWSTAGWQDVTPQGIEVNILWGSNRAELGILSRPDADSWAISYFDPFRLLDPANADGPYFGDLEAGLPVRTSHRGIVIRQGYAESIGHAYADSMFNGYMRVTNNLSRLANAQVPSDTALSDTLYARAEDAIAAAGLSVRVLAPVGTDPPVAPWITDTNEWSAWQWIMDAAEQVHHIPIIDRVGSLHFRPWAAPLSRGRSIDSPNLLDLQVIADYSGQFSVIKALDDDGVTIETRALTPPPRYGARTYERTDPTIDAASWAETVLADRALPGLRWLPGTVMPFSAADVEAFATIEAVELVSMAVPEQDPPVSATAIIVGGNIRIRGKRNAEAVWLFEFQAAQTATEPLIESGGDPTDYLLATGGDQFLYPST